MKLSQALHGNRVLAIFFFVLVEPSRCFSEMTQGTSSSGNAEDWLNHMVSFTKAMHKMLCVKFQHMTSQIRRVCFDSDLN